MVHSSLANNDSEALTDGETLADYATFGSLETVELNALEEQTLEALRKKCMARHCPELPQARIDASVSQIAPRNKARCVVLSVLCNNNPLALLGQLMGGSGFASHWLLDKLFHRDYVMHLQSEAPIGTAVDYQFCRAFKVHLAMLKPVRNYVDEYVRAAIRIDFGDYVARNGSRASAFDLGVLGARKQAQEHWYILPEIAEQIELWLTSVSEELVSRICEVVRVILHSDALTHTGVASYKTYVTGIVACNPHREVLRLLNTFHNPRSVQLQITNILKDDGYRRVHPGFFLNYLKWLRVFSNSPVKGVCCAWKRYLRDGYMLQHVLQICEKPCFFLREVPHSALYDFLMQLSAVTDDMPRRDSALRVIMKNLSFYNFTRVLAKAGLGGHQALMRFVLGYLDDDTRAAYLAGAKNERGYSGTNGTKTFMDMYVDIEAELEASTHGAHNTDDTRSVQ
ncbi:hypothetical protein PAPHI01_2237 [Pancytospora philotis]|nr:hypothetical protein PAPHI01_2237 [Pancytospora philotis]